MTQSVIHRKMLSGCFTGLILLSNIFSSCATTGQNATQAQATPTSQSILSQTPTTQSSGSVPTQTTNKVIPQGVYESCPLKNGTSCLDHLKQIAAGGFTLVVNYDQFAGTADQEVTYAKTAAALGIKIIWAMNNPVFWNGTTDLTQYYSDLAATCNCSDNAGFTRYIVNLVKDLPATWGYYVGDEVPLKKHDQMKAFSDLIHQTDSKHPRLFIGDTDTVDALASYLTTFVDTAEVIGNDYYPIGVDNLTTTEAGTRAKIVQQVANAAHLQSTMVLQSFSLGQYPNATCNPFPACAPYPSIQQMRQMRDLTLSNSQPQFVLWYSYFDIFQSNAPATHWNNLIQAAGVAAKAR